MKILYFDAFSGIAGDMVLGALLDAGLSLSYLKKELKKLPNLSGYTISSKKIKRSSISATSFIVKITKKQKSRDYKAIKKMINSSTLSVDVKRTALKIFEKIAIAEAEIHGTTVGDVHFHEVGGVDSIVDIVGSAIGFSKLGIKKFYSSPLPLGSGLVNTRHGVMPIPAPATLRILKGVPVIGSDEKMELVTPTGGAIVSALSSGFGSMPAMKPVTDGYGGGTKERADGLPNLLRIVIGDVREAPKKLLVIESNIDDSTPEEIAYARGRLLKSGALDVWATPIMMKKGRLATLLSVLCEAGKAKNLREILLNETSSIGVREYEVNRYELPRETIKVKTKYGTVRVKVVITPSGEKRLKPEYDDVAKLAKKHSVPFREVFNSALKR